MANPLICPLPLLTFNDQSQVNLYDTTVIYASSDTNCVVPCPTIVWNENEWDTLQNVLFVGSL